MHNITDFYYSVIVELQFLNNVLGKYFKELTVKFSLTFQLCITLDPFSEIRLASSTKCDSKERLTSDILYFIKYTSEES